ncbi:UDP-GalNAc:beta-1,3-N-acetylgalactosaminyltransferase 2 isoform X2 [Parasteatoda tepidariorum]|uniref:UDP-GalNAc:beta-1, 3-N-acetylgalactosaminyltransferase 2 isoform X2 n=1 Tax=Parasteatoda tepidariorum TaxID=114398 RepID=UPI001C728713|nr:UDP-GalNAc:beta-1,3-N-acetylgalactosaminyltransferase 2 isoform X2 [Parasteatoda tepidariorum]
MLSFFQAFFCIAFGVILLIFKENFFKFSSVVFYKNFTVLVVGILSARENSLQRSVARSTWLSDYQFRNSDYVKAWFIIGNSSCSIPPKYRLSQYGCEKWKINITDLEREVYTLKEMEFGNCSSQMVTVHQGFTFKVNHPLIVTKLGVLFQAIVPKKKSKIAIMDIHSKEIIVEATIFNNSSESHHGYLYSPVENILLPKIYSSPHHQDSTKYSETVYSAVSIGFIVNEKESLKKIYNEEITETEKWQLHLKKEEEKINSERNQYGDLLIVDDIDIYRNLPNKVLQFFKWLHTNQDFSYVMKTDDDTVVNLEALMKELQQTSKFDSKQLWLWSRFRKNWPVNYVGKWADDDYRSDYYPAFPCGAAYITSHQTASWLSQNSDSLFPYQGEDVSIGIWLSAINPTYIEDEHFECDSSCNSNSYNRAQLEPEEIQRAWSVFKMCKNVCSCTSR